MNIFKAIFCKHKDKVEILTAKEKYIMTGKFLKGTGIMRYDIFSEVKCEYCGKVIIRKNKIKSNCHYWTMKLIFKN